MDKENEKLAIKLFGHGLMMFSVFGFVILATFPTLILFSTIGGFNAENYSFIIKIIIYALAVGIIVLVAFIQLIWLGLIAALIHSIEKKIKYFEALKQVRMQWDKIVNDNLKKMAKKGRH